MDIKETELIELLRRDVQRGMALLIDCYGGAVKSICSHILRNCDSSIIEDSVQDTFVSLWEKLTGDDCRVQNLKSYVYQCARNQALTDMKKIREEQNLSLEEFQYTGVEELVSTSRTATEKQAEVSIGFQCVHNILDEIGEPDRTIFVLRYFYNYTVKEISRHMKIKEDNVESKIRRCKQRLKTKLEERGVFYEE